MATTRSGIRIGLALVLAASIGVAVTPAYAAPCGFDDPTGPDVLCEVSFDGTWRPATDPELGGQPNRTNVLGTVTPSPSFSFFNNFSEPVGIDFATDRDFESAYFASRGTPLLTVLGFLDGAEVASLTIDFRSETGGSGFSVFAIYTFDHTFDQIDALEFHPTTFGFPEGFGEFLMDDANIVATTVAEPGLLGVLGLALIGLGRQRFPR